MVRSPSPVVTVIWLQSCGPRDSEAKLPAGVILLSVPSTLSAPSPWMVAGPPPWTSKQGSLLNARQVRGGMRRGVSCSREEWHLHRLRALLAASTSPQRGHQEAEGTSLPLAVKRLTEDRLCAHTRALASGGGEWQDAGLAVRRGTATREEKAEEHVLFLSSGERKIWRQKWACGRLRGPLRDLVKIPRSKDWEVGGGEGGGDSCCFDLLLSQCSRCISTGREPRAGPQQKQAPL